MGKITLKLHEIYSLHGELNGLVNNQTGEVVSKGLLAEKLKLSTKYYITELAKTINKEREIVDKVKEELIKKHGEVDENGGVFISRFINTVKNEEGKIISGDINPKIISFEKEFNEFLQDEKTIEYKEFKLSDFDGIETEGIYTTFFKLVKPE
jgi:hypothetical protein